LRISAKFYVCEDIKVTVNPSQEKMTFLHADDRNRACQRNWSLKMGRTSSHSCIKRKPSYSFPAKAI